jgi:hypothetical protein
MAAILARMTLQMALAIALILGALALLDPAPPPMLVEAVPADYSTCVRVYNGPLKPSPKLRGDRRVQEVA